MIELAFELGFLFGRRYESLYEKSGLYNGIAIDFESLAIAAQAGANLTKIPNQTEKPLIYESIAFSHCNKEILLELERLLVEKQEMIKMLLENKKF